MVMTFEEKTELRAAMSVGAGFQMTASDPRGDELDTVGQVRSMVSAYNHDVQNIEYCRKYKVSLSPIRGGGSTIRVTPDFGWKPLTRRRVLALVADKFSRQAFERFADDGDGRATFMLLAGGRIAVINAIGLTEDGEIFVFKKDEYPSE